jgi:hypothetical protein
MKEELLIGKDVADDTEADELPLRLCSEIQLFDLCDLELCAFKDGRYCTHADLLARFEALAEPDDRPAGATRQAVDDEEDDEPEFKDEQEEDDDEDGYSVFDEEDDQEQDNW